MSSKWCCRGQHKGRGNTSPRPKEPLNAETFNGCMTCSFRRDLQSLIPARSYMETLRSERYVVGNEKILLGHLHGSVCISELRGCRAKVRRMRNSSVQIFYSTSRPLPDLEPVVEAVVEVRRLNIPLKMPQPLPSKEASLFRQVVKCYEQKQHKKGTS